ncbi:MAG TPA: VCBS repeat-containing protein [Bryobacteraceae bacterium]|nr:VCBS repeat-containing protein [Bryobacteraceae bacterium]
MNRDSYSRGWLGIYCAVFALIANANVHAQTPTFFPLNPVSVGSNPSALAIANTHGVGNPDLVVVNGGSDSLTIERGLGYGYFLPWDSQTTGGSPRAVAVADFNGDGILDLAVANFASSNVSIFLGIGNGTFRPFGRFDAVNPSAIVAGDFDRDGKTDLAVTENTSNAGESTSDSVVIFRGLGNGTFVPFYTAAVGHRPVSMVAADFNGDGITDLAVANSVSGDVSVLLGYGRGTFLPARNATAGLNPTFLALGDFNGDGKPDLAVVNARLGSNSTVYVLLGLGNGFFRLPLIFTAGDNSSFVVAGDFNLDGKTDLAVANSGSNTISIFLGMGYGIFQPAQDFTVGPNPSWIGVADLTGDGKPDLVVANGGSNNVSVLINHTASRPR